LPHSESLAHASAACDVTGMGRRGTSHHARGQHAATQFAKLGVPCAIIATNDRWTTFALLDEINTANVAAVLDAVVMRIDADDDHGSSASFYAPDGWSAELVVEMMPSDPTLTSADRDLFAELIRRAVLTSSQGSRLQEQLERLRNRSGWLESDGLEKELGVPNAIPLWTPVTREVLVVNGLDVEIVKPSKRAAKPAIKAPAVDAATRHAPIDPRVLAAHVYYWKNVFEMNGWVLYHRYKKHLPAERRREVDKLCELLVRGEEPGEIEQAVERILSAVWSSDDWVAALREPRLAADEALSGERLAAWQRQLERMPGAAVIASSVRKREE